jgi:hypothetical protein
MAGNAAACHRASRFAVLYANRSTRVNYRGCLIAIETYKYIDHTAICNTNIIVYGIELTIKGHPSMACRAARPPLVLKELRFSAKSMPSPDFFGSPFEFWQMLSLIV